MKEIMAIIQTNMVSATKKALVGAGISSLTARECLGRGKGPADPAQQTARLIPKRLLSIVVPDRLVQKTVQAIIAANQTGKPGDGKIFVLPIDESWRIRTGEYGDKVLDDA